MRRYTSCALAALSLALACAGPAGAGSPRILSVDTGPPAVLDRALELQITAEQRGEQVQGVRVSFPDLGGVFAVSACRIAPAGARATAELAPDAFAVPYRPAWTGLHLLELAVTAGDCAGSQATSRRSLPLDVGVPGEAGAPPATALAPSRCPGADNLPLRPRLRALRLTLVCLLNAERRAAGLTPLRTSAALRRAAVTHVHDMREQAYVGHARTGGPGLRERLRAAGVRARATGENLGVGPGRLGTPRSIVGAWMASDPLRRNVLDPRFSRVGVAAIATVPGVVRRSGGTYAADFAR